MLKRIWGWVTGQVSAADTALRSIHGYAAAAHSRLMADWVFAATVSADRALKGDFITLRARARDVVRNTWIGRRYVDLVVENVIGENGLALQGMIERDGRPDTEANRELERDWREWGRIGTRTVDGRHSFCDAEEVAVRTFTAEGEGLVRLIDGADNPFGFAIQVLDPDQLDDQYNEPPDHTGREIRMGVETDRWGRPVRYHVFRRHPRDAVTDADRAPAPREWGSARGVRESLGVDHHPDRLGVHLEVRTVRPSRILGEPPRGGAPQGAQWRLERPPE